MLMMSLTDQVCFVQVSSQLRIVKVGPGLAFVWGSRFSGISFKCALRCLNQVIHENSDGPICKRRARFRLSFSYGRSPKPANQ